MPVWRVVGVAGAVAVAATSATIATRLPNGGEVGVQANAEPSARSVAPAPATPKTLSAAGLLEAAAVPCSTQAIQPQLDWDSVPRHREPLDAALSYGAENLRDPSVTFAPAAEPSTGRAVMAGLRNGRPYMALDVLRRRDGSWTVERTAICNGTIGP